MIANPIDFRRLAKLAAHAAADKKASDIVVLDVRKDSDIADYIVIASAHSSPQLWATYEGVVAALQDIGVRLVHQDGHARDRWMALDYGGLLVHIFMADARQFYRLEHLWEHPHRVRWETHGKEKSHK